MKFYSFDLDFDLVTLILKLDLDIIKMSLCTKNEVPAFRQTDRQTHKQTRLKILPTANADGNKKLFLKVQMICICASYN